MPTLRRYVPPIWSCGLLLITAALATAQSPFDAPPIAEPAASTGQGVRGLYDPNRPIAPPAGAIGASQAPAASFEAPPNPFSNPEPNAAPSADVTHAKPLEGSEILARVNGQVILASDVLWQVNQIIAINRAKVEIPEEHMAPLREMLLRQQVTGLIVTKLIFADFRRTVPAENLPQIEEAIAKPFDETEVPRLVKMLKVNDRGELEELLKASGTSIKDIQRQFVEKTVASEWMRSRLPKTKPVTHEEMLAYYQDHLKEYEFPAQVRWEELMVRFDRSGGDRDGAWRALAEMGNEVWSVVRENPQLRGPVFAAVAKAKSHGATAGDGGLHEWMTLGALKCEGLNTALETLAVGQMSDGIESEQGFHIVRVLERREAGRKTFEEEQGNIRTTLENEQKAVLMAAQLEKLAKTARVWSHFDGELSGARMAELLKDPQKR